MAEKLSVKKSPVDSIIECPLCLQQLNIPLTLQQCLHSYCKSCLEKVPQKTQHGCQGLLCPMCDNFSRCDQIQRNTFIEELQKIHTDGSGPNTCEQCSDGCGQATWKCADCKIRLCESSKILHLKIPMLKSHKIIPLDNDREQLIDNIVFCKMHEDIPVQMNCQDCDKLICYMCIMHEHQAHIAESVEIGLARILPETESSVRQVDENIAIMEAQINGVNKQIEQTKESYAFCRIQMDEHLEKVICRMRAMKAQMEEDVNEQESIALDTLKDIKQQLERQLSQARILCNLTDVVTTKTRQTSQLQQLQNGLFAKVKSAAEVQNKSLSFTLQATSFCEGQRFQEELGNVFGKLAFCMEEQIINISGEQYTTDNQFLYSNLNKLSGRQFKKDKEIVVNVDWCNRLSYIDNKIWLPIGRTNEINIYNEDGELENVINTDDKDITVVKTAHNGAVICAGASGLFLTDKQFINWTMLSGGKFHTVVVNKEQLIALQLDCKTVRTYSRLEALNGQGTWYESHSFKLTAKVNINSNSLIYVVADKYLLISTISDAELKGLYKFSLEGEYLDSCNDLPFYPVICGTDRNDQVLVAEFTTGAMYLFRPLLEKEIQRTTIMSDVQTPQTRSVVIDKNNNCWILSGDNNYKLIKFTSDK